MAQAEDPQEVGAVENGENGGQPDIEKDLPPISEQDAQAYGAAPKKASAIQKLKDPRNRKAVFVIGGMVGLLGFVAISNMGGSDNNVAVKKMAKSTGAEATPGQTGGFVAGAKTNPNYAKILESQQAQQQEEDLKSGKSGAPAFVNTEPVTGFKPKPAPKPVVEKPAPEVKAPAPAPTVVIHHEVPKGQEEFVKEQEKELQFLEKSWNIPQTIQINSLKSQNGNNGNSIPKPEKVSDTNPVTAKTESSAKTGKETATQLAEKEGLNLIGAGELSYGIIDVSADSDQPGPVLATIEDGPLKGARLLGRFADVNNRLIMQFTVATLPNQASFPIDAVAVNPKNNRTAIAVSVNHHYLERFGLLLGGSFLSGFGQAIQSQGSTTVSSGAGIVSTVSPLTLAQEGEAALGNVGQTIGQIGEQDYSQIKPTVRVPEGTPVGILFMKAVPVKVVEDAAQGVSRSTGLSGAAVQQPQQAPTPVMRFPSNQRPQFGGLPYSPPIYGAPTTYGYRPTYAPEVQQVP